MEFEFDIINRYDLAAGVETPIGWDSNKVTLKRDLNWHGVFFENQDNTFEFFGKGARLLKQEKDAYGIQGKMDLAVYVVCENGDREELQRGSFDFGTYEYLCDGCRVRIQVGTSKDVMDLRNRINQKVDLDTLTAFDGTTPLAPYAGLGFSLTLPSKGIFLQDQATAKNPSVEQFEGGLQPVLTGSVNANLTHYQIQFGLPDNQLSEIGGFSVQPTHTMDLTVQNGVQISFPHFSPGVFPGNALWPLNLSPILNYTIGSTNYGDISNPVTFDIRIKGNLEILDCRAGTTTFYLLRLPDRPGYLTNGEHEADYDFMAQLNIINTGCGNSISCYIGPNAGTFSFDFVYNAPVTLVKGDRFYLFLSGTERKTSTELTAVNAGSKALRLTLDTDSHIKITNVSKTVATVAKAYLVNEAWSRVCEAVTDNRMKVYSEYFGRTDSEPYAVANDGCGGLEAITNGLRVRRAENIIPGNTSPFTLSLQDMFTGLSPIHNIGAGPEPDPARPGYKRLRIETWDKFYENTLILSCTNIGQISSRVQPKEIYSVFKFGYGKWEAEYYNGLDEFLTKREYRTALSEIKNELTKYSTMVASGYALEITRRIRSNVDTKDWRYDKETFIICCTRERLFHAVFVPLPTGGLIIVDYIEPGTPFTGATITVANSQYNDGVYSVFSVVYNSVSGTATIQVTSSPLTAEDTYGVAFPGVVFPPSINVELGNVASPQNIIDPGTLYNYRISPIRMAMRWLNRLFSSYKVFGPSNVALYTDGDGNNFAEGLMASAVCRYEAAAVAENQTLSSTMLADPDKAKPFLAPERVVYEHPMSLKDFRAVKANPRGKIFYSGTDTATGACIDGFGFIDTVTYQPPKGTALFTLIPQINA